MQAVEIKKIRKYPKEKKSKNIKDYAKKILYSHKLFQEERKPKKGRISSLVMVCRVFPYRQLDYNLVGWVEICFRLSSISFFFLFPIVTCLVLRS